VRTPSIHLIELTWQDGPGISSLRAEGWASGDLRAFTAAVDVGSELSVFPADALCNGDIPAQGMPGEFNVTGDAVTFVPRFPFVEGTMYVLVRRGGHVVGQIERMARQIAPQAAVLAIHPDAAEVPLNLLKLYVTFSEPMCEGWSRRSVHLRRPADETVLDDALLLTEPELWDQRRTRLTLLIHPGRIKRGLMPNSEKGYPLIEGGTIDVEVDSTFRTARGSPLRTGTMRRYRVGAALRQRVNPAHWTLVPPQTAHDALTVHFDRPLDNALLARCLSVHRAGAIITGVATPGASGLSWAFRPHARWRAGDYTLQVDPRLEDLAGNSVARLFDRDLFLQEDDSPAPAGDVVLFFHAATSRPAAPVYP
jgi:hypothetical protein